MYLSNSLESVQDWRLRRRVWQLLYQDLEAIFISFFNAALALLTILRQLQIQILIHFLQSQCANKSVQLITYNYYITNN